jgi:pilus assembly protein CpaC
MHRTNRVARVPLGGLLLISLVVAGAHSGAQEKPEQAPPPRPAGVQGGGPIIIPINVTKPLQMSIKPPPRIKTVHNDRETVARVTAGDDPTSVNVTGLTPGTAAIRFEAEDGRTETIEVVVQFDVSYLNSLIERSVPTANVTPIPGTNNTIVLTGWVQQAEDIETIVRLTQSVVGNLQGVINAMRIGGVQQVQLDVVVARVTRSEFRRMSFDFMNFGFNHVLASTTGGAFRIPSAGISGTFPGNPTITNQVGQPNGAPANIFLALFNQNQDFFGLLQALRDENLAKILAEPRLVTLTGRPASFVAGGEQAVPTVSGFGGTAGVDFVPFGTRLNFLPIVLGNGKIYLEVEPEISALDAGAGVVIPGGGLVPGRVLQRVRTSVVMEDGQTFALGGLVQHTVQNSDSKIPLLGDIPFIGVAFSRKSSQEIEEELVIMVTPHLVDPMDCHQIPKALPGMETRMPDDFELFLEGILEAPRGKRCVSPDGKHYVPAYKHDPTMKVYPCGPADCNTGCRFNGWPGGDTFQMFGYGPNGCAAQFPNLCPNGGDGAAGGCGCGTPGAAYNGGPAPGPVNGFATPPPAVETPTLPPIGDGVKQTGGLSPTPAGDAGSLPMLPGGYEVGGRP